VALVALIGAQQAAQAVSTCPGGDHLCADARGHRCPAGSLGVLGGCRASNESRNASQSKNANAESTDPHVKPMKHPKLHKAMQAAKALSHSAHEKMRRVIHRTGQRREGDPSQDYQAAVCRASPAQCAAGVGY
jgi:hypothetical protein